MSVDCVIDDVGFSANEPFKKGFFGIVQHLVPFFEPFKFCGFFSPEPFEVITGKLGSFFPIFQIGLGDYFIGRIIDFTFHLPFQFLDSHKCSSYGISNTIPINQC